MLERELLIGVVAGIVATLAWTVLMEFRRWIRSRRALRPLSGTYSVARKEATKLEDEQIVVTAKTAALHLEYRGLPNGNSASGRVPMDERYLASGQGQYVHLQQDRELWGLWGYVLRKLD
jgi:hypothetical protein